MLLVLFLLDVVVQFCLAFAFGCSWSQEREAKIVTQSLQSARCIAASLQLALLALRSLAFLPRSWFSVVDSKLLSTLWAFSLAASGLGWSRAWESEVVSGFSLLFATFAIFGLGIRELALGEEIETAMRSTPKLAQALRTPFTMNAHRVVVAFLVFQLVWPFGNQDWGSVSPISPISPVSSFVSPLNLTDPNQTLHEIYMWNPLLMRKLSSPEFYLPALACGVVDETRARKAGRDRERNESWELFGEEMEFEDESETKTETETETETESSLRRLEEVPEWCRKWTGLAIECKILLFLALFVFLSADIVPLSSEFDAFVGTGICYFTFFLAYDVALQILFFPWAAFGFQDRGKDSVSFLTFCLATAALACLTLLRPWLYAARKWHMAV